MPTSRAAALDHPPAGEQAGPDGDEHERERERAVAQCMHQQRRLVRLQRPLGAVQHDHPQHAAVAEHDGQGECGGRAHPEGGAAAGEVEQLLGHGSGLQRPWE
jgi:hypothetical protein